MGDDKKTEKEINEGLQKTLDNQKIEEGKKKAKEALPPLGVQPVSLTQKAVSDIERHNKQNKDALHYE